MTEKNLPAGFSLAGKTALVTGAFSGLGRDFAHMLGESGATLALAGRRMEEGRRLADELAKAGVRAHAVRMDVEQAASVESAFGEILAELGTPDILINNA